MKLILLLFFLTSCTQKYQTYYVIDKYNFNKDNYEAPIAKKMLPKNKVEREICADQIFFSSNAYKETSLLLTNTMKSLCGDDKYLLNTRLTETWWTVLLYSKSCVKVETYCPRK